MRMTLVHSQSVTWSVPSGGLVKGSKVRAAGEKAVLGHFFAISFVHFGGAFLLTWD